MLHEERFLFIAWVRVILPFLSREAFLLKGAGKTDAANKTYFKIADFFVFPRPNHLIQGKIDD